MRTVECRSICPAKQACLVAGREIDLVSLRMSHALHVPDACLNKVWGGGFNFGMSVGACIRALHEEGRWWMESWDAVRYFMRVARIGRFEPAFLCES